jgi:glycosyltransferase involved in cell wall biosynthesis
MAKTQSCAIVTNQAFSIVNFRGPLIRDMVAAGVKVYALAPDYDSEMRHLVYELGANPVDLSLAPTGMNPFRDALDVLRLAALLRRLSPDVVLGYFIKPVIYGTLAAWLAGVPLRVMMIEGLGYIFTPSDSSQTKKRKWLRTLASSLYRFSLTHAHKVIFLNRDDIYEFVNAGLVDESKVVNLGGIGVNLVDWPFTQPVSKPLTFLLSARLLREKGIVEYAEAARQVKISNPTVRFILLGGFDTNPGRLDQAELDLWVNQGLLEWPGHVEVKSWLAQASVFVLPSYREGIPRSTQEAMAMGRAVITTDVPGCRETVDEGINGFLVPVRDVSALANAMLRFVENPSLIGAMGLESRRLAEMRFDVRIINPRLMKILGVSN